MIKIVIIEDEIPARKKLRRFIEQQGGTTEVVKEISTVELAIAFLESNEVDLIFSDIELLDGNAFEIYRQVFVSCPIIFTTAYDQFWMEAFEINGIAYLLKPFGKDRFQKAYDKFLRLSKNKKDPNHAVDGLYKLLEQQIAIKRYKSRFTIHTGQKIYFLQTENISFFEANEGVVFAVDTKGDKHLLNEVTLKEIEEKLDPLAFFRINRSEMVSKKHLEKLEMYGKNAFAIKMVGHADFLKTSQSNTAMFRIWIEK